MFRCKHDTLLKTFNAVTSWFLLVTCWILRMEAECPSQESAESAALPSPPYGSAASSRGSAAADVPTPDPLGKPAQRGPG